LNARRAQYPAARRLVPRPVQPPTVTVVEWHGMDGALPAGAGLSASATATPCSMDLNPGHGTTGMAGSGRLSGANARSATRSERVGFMINALRRCSVALLMLPLVLMLASCVKYETAIKISANDHVDISMLLAVQQQYASLVRESCTPNGASSVPAGSISSYSQDGYVGCTIKGSGIPLINASNQNGVFSITHQNAQYTFQMKNTTSDTTSDTSLTSAMFTTFKLAVTFPGEVTSHSGSSTVEGTTVTWTDPDDALKGNGLKATSKEADLLLLAVPWALGLAGLLLVAAVAIAVWGHVRSRRTVSDVPDNSQDDATYPTPYPVTYADPRTGAPAQSPEASGASNSDQTSWPQS